MKFQIENARLNGSKIKIESYDFTWSGELYINSKKHIFTEVCFAPKEEYLTWRCKNLMGKILEFDSPAEYEDWYALESRTEEIPVPHKIGEPTSVDDGLFDFEDHSFWANPENLFNPAESEPQRESCQIDLRGNQCTIYIHLDPCVTSMAIAGCTVRYEFDSFSEI